MRNFFLLLLLTLFSLPAFAQHPDKRPSVELSPQRSLDDLGFQRAAAARDSTLQGGNNWDGNEGRVPFDAVALPPCTISPNSPGCFEGFIDDRPPPVGGGVPEMAHCGVPVNYSLNRDPDCSPVAGGWRCFRLDSGVIFYECP